MKARTLALVLFTALSAQACTVALPVTLGVRASQQNARANAAAARTGKPPELQSVGVKLVGGFLAGAVIDLMIVYIIASNVPVEPQ